jgi:hypothetical protein
VRVRYTPRAFADREAIFEYINQHNPRAAREVKAFIARRVAELGESPPVHHRMIARLGVHALYLAISAATPTSCTIALAATKLRSFTFVMPRADRGKARGISR